MRHQCPSAGRHYFVGLKFANAGAKGILRQPPGLYCESAWICIVEWTPSISTEVQTALTKPSDPCPLCESSRIRPYVELQRRRYYICEVCHLVWLCPEQRPDAATERAYYDTHENDPADAGYRAFLDQLVNPLLQRLTAGARGLDYGCGPGPALSVMLREQGFPMTEFDPYFAPVRSVLEQSYDFITCTEAAEHFFTPCEEFARFNRLLCPGGWLGVMTGFRPEDTQFAAWHYRRDPTHVCFYTPQTMRWIACQHGWSLGKH